MATSAPIRAAYVIGDRQFFSAAAAFLVLATFVGFVPTYYLMPLFDAPALSPLVHLHGIVFTAWILLFAGQTALITGKRPDLHRIVGTAGAGLALVVIVLGVVVAIESGRRGGGGPLRNQPVFLVYPFTNMALFAGFCLAAIRARRRSQSHKRLMLIATLALVVTPLARISKMLELPFSPPAIGGMLMSNLVLIALAAFDWHRQGRLHPVTLWGGGLYLASQPLRVALGNSEPWQAFARSIIA